LCDLELVDLFDNAVIEQVYFLPRGQKLISVGIKGVFFLIIIYITYTLEAEINTPRCRLKLYGEVIDCAAGEKGKRSFL